jgi:hypothetical protein
MRSKLKDKTQDIPLHIIGLVISDSNGHPNELTISTIKKILLKNKAYGYLDCAPRIYDMIKGDRITVSNEECVVCFESISMAIKLECKHYFCELCLFKISSNGIIVCPLCRNEQSYHRPRPVDDELTGRICEYYKVHKDQYMIPGRNCVRFDDIIDDIIAKLDE